MTRVHQKVAQKVVAIGLSAMMLFGCVQYVMTPAPVYATTIAAEQEKIDNLTEDKKELLAELEALQAANAAEQEKYDDYVDEMADIRAAIAEFEAQIEDLNEEISGLEDEIAVVNGEIKIKVQEIKDKEEEIDIANEKFKARLAAMYISSGDMTVMNVLLGAESFSDFLTQSEALKNISEYDVELMQALTLMKEELQTLKDELQDEKDLLEEKKAEVEGKKAEVEGLQADKEAEEEDMQVLIDESNAILARNEANQAANKELTSKINSDIASAEKEIDDLIAEAEAAAKEEAEKEEASNGSSSNGGSSSTVTPSSGWAHPCPGYSYMSSKFGYRTAPTTGASTYHGGVDLAAGHGTPIYAVKSGVVMKENSDSWGGGYGNYLLLDHKNGYYSMYAHCSSKSVDKGDTVSQGQLIAKVGSTGVSTGNHLHFEIRKGSTKVNPENYINF